MYRDLEATLLMSR